MVRRNRIRVKKLASLIGLIQSCRLAIGPIVGIFSKSSYSLISSACYWRQRVK